MIILGLALILHFEANQTDFQVRFAIRGVSEEGEKEESHFSWSTRIGCSAVNKLANVENLARWMSLWLRVIALGPIN